MATDAEVVFTGSAQQLLAEYQKLRDADRKQEQGLQQQAATSRQLAQQERQRQRDAKQAIEQTLTAQEKYNQRIARFNELHRTGHLTVDQLNRSLTREKALFDEAGGGASAATRRVHEFVQSITGIGTVVAGVAVAARAVKFELDEIKRRGEEGRAAQVSAAESLRQAKLAFVPDQSVGRGQFEPRALAIARATGADPGVVSQALQSTLSAKGSLSNDVAFNAVQQALRVNPKDAGQASELASRALDIAKVTGSQDPRAALGFLQNIQTASRVTDLRKVGQNLTPAIVSLTGLGDTPEQAAELTAAITQLTADAEGAQSGTAAVQTAELFRQFARDTGDQRFTQGPTAAIQALQQDPQLRTQFLDAFKGKLPVETKQRNAIERLISGEAGAVAELRQAQQTINAPGAGQAAEFENLIGFLDAGQFDPQRSLETRSAGNIRDAHLRTGVEARRAAVRKIVGDTLRQVDLPGLDALARPTRETALEGEFLRHDPEQAGIQVLGGLARSGGVSRGDQSLLIEQMRLLAQELQRNTQATRENTQPGGSPARPPNAQLSRNN